MRDGGEDFDGKAWWQEQKVWIHQKYGNELIPNAKWWTDAPYDPEADDKSADFDDLGKALPVHFTNQVIRIPHTKPLTPEHLFQMALNDGYASVTHGLRLSSPREYVEFEEARRNPPKGIKISHYPDPDPESEEGTMRIDLHKDGENIGFLLHHERDGEVWLDYVNVVRDYRQEGLGKFLLDELRKMYKGKEIYLHAPLGQARDWVPEWYEKVGFKLIEPGSNKMVLQNPSPWRHGEQMKNDPFEGEFE